MPNHRIDLGPALDLGNLGSGIDEKYGRLGVHQDETCLVRPGIRVDRRRRATGGGDGHVGNNPLGARSGQQGDAALPRKPQLHQPSGHLVGLTTEFSKGHGEPGVGLIVSAGRSEKSDAIRMGIGLSIKHRREVLGRGRNEFVLQSKGLLVTGTPHQLTLSSVKNDFCHAIAWRTGRSPQFPTTLIGRCLQGRAGERSPHHGYDIDHVTGRFQAQHP